MGSVLSILLFVAVFYLMMRYGCGAHMHGGGCGNSSDASSKKAPGFRQSLQRETTHSGPGVRDADSIGTRIVFCTLRS
jgi:hypothetical protein